MLKIILATLSILLISHQLAYALPTITIEKGEEYENNQFIYLDPKSLSENQIEFTLRPRGLIQSGSELFGMAFDLVYDPTILEYKSFEKGAFFEQGGTPVYMIAPHTNALPARLISGITLKSGDNFPSKDTHILKFVFELKESGKTALVFEKKSAYTLEKNQKKRLDTVYWKDITLTVEKEQQKNTIPIKIKNLTDFLTSWFTRTKLIISLLLTAAAIGVLYLLYIKKRQVR